MDPGLQAESAVKPRCARSHLWTWGSGLMESAHDNSSFPNSWNATFLIEAGMEQVTALKLSKNQSCCPLSVPSADEETESDREKMKLKAQEAGH